MQRSFLWLSGADEDVLRNCAALHRSERMRLAGIGALVLVPAILGSLGMAYALSLVTDLASLCLGGGTVWGLIVLAIDRYLVSTMHKSEVRHWVSTTVTVLLRLIFALVVGTAVAHPLSLLWFEDSITQTIDEHRRTTVATRVDLADADVDAVSEVESTAAPLQEARDKQVAQKECLVKLQTYEQSNAPSKETGCGISSGRAGCGSNCVQLGTRIDDVQQEIRILDEKIAAAQKVDAAAELIRQQRIEEIRGRSKADIAAIEATFSDDYLARVAALAELERKDPQVWLVSLFLIGLFVLVDVMPMTMKLATPMGQYERVRDTAVMRGIHAEQAKREAIPQIELAVAELYADAEKLMTEMNVLTRVSVDVLGAWQQHCAAVEEQVRLVRQRTPSGQELAAEGRILDIRKVDEQAWNSIVAHTMAFVRRP
ncbi:DUF4407 domain-containing protein [Dactylosporangium sp. CA-152071]|uniref:DUF4407 domain-containing protein n=1 Tax=Dactylosporangium sp. CA-152071 TaxID=3239933 RepID=UPI003D89B352